SFAGVAGLAQCQVVVQCSQIPVTYNGGQANGYRLESVGTCGSSDLTSANPDFVVSRTLMAEAYDGGTP
ncbi:MAG: MSHA biogenesis protein MshP, partial [Aeromonas sobria]